MTSPRDLSPGVETSLSALISADPRRVLVLDDDPTGSQAASDVDVILRPDTEAIRDWLDNGDRGLYLVTNTRSMSAADGVKLLRKIRTSVDELCRVSGHEVTYVLRGDSTLRGYIFEESAVFEDAGGVLLFCPAFPAGGRVTIGGVHYLRTDAGTLPVVETEFASDPVFGYRSLSLADWVAERGETRPVVSVDLARLRSDGARGFADVLANAPAGAVVIPDSETDSDVALVAAGLLIAERSGRQITVRCAATLAALRLGSRPKQVSKIHMECRRILVVCGSHTSLSTRQLAALTEDLGEPVTVTADMAFADPPTTEAATAQVLRRLDEFGVAVLASERLRRPEHHRLSDGAAVMTALTDVVASVRHRVDACIVKGGITSADVAVRGLGCWRGTVLGQIEPGVSAWLLRTATDQSVPYVVVPGNVGDDGTLARCFQALVPKVPGGATRDDETSGNGSASVI